MEVCLNVKEDQFRCFKYEEVAISVQPWYCERADGKGTFPTHGAESFVKLGGDRCYCPMLNKIKDIDEITIFFLCSWYSDCEDGCQ